MGKRKNTSQLLEKKGSHLLFACLLLATGTGTDKVPGTLTTPPLSEALSVHNHTEESHLNTA